MEFTFAQKAVFDILKNRAQYFEINEVKQNVLTERYLCDGLPFHESCYGFPEDVFSLLQKCLLSLLKEVRSSLKFESVYTLNFINYTARNVIVELLNSDKLLEYIYCIDTKLIEYEA